MLYSPTYNVCKRAPLSGLVYAILADARERMVIPHFPAGSLNVRQIECGDFQVWCQNPATLAEVPVAVIERKTWKDLAASIVDGRADSQHARMIEFSRKNSSLVYYIIEGPVFQPRDKPFPRSNLTFASLVKRLDHWSNSGAVIVKHSRDHADTAQRIADLVRNLSDDRETHQRFTVLHATSESAATGGPPENTRVHTEPRLPALWTGLPGVSHKTATLLAGRFGLAEILAMAPTEENVGLVVQAMRDAGGRCGKKTGRKILSYDPVRLLATIKGVSKTRATAIVAAYPDCVAQIARGEAGTMLEAIGTVPNVRANRTIGEKIRAAVFEGAPV